MPAAALGNADLVFFGQASFLGEAVTDQADSPIEEFTEFSVEGVWKGPAQKRLRIYTQTSKPHCAYAFEAGKRYLVYANRDRKRFSNRFRASACSRTKPADHSLPDLAILGDPEHRFDR